jgi:hypothetical protein
LQDTPKFTRIRTFGLKTNHLATLLASLRQSTHAEALKTKTETELTLICRSGIEQSWRCRTAFALSGEEILVAQL